MKVLVLSTILSISVTARAQKITIVDLKYLQTHSVEEAEDYLRPKDFKFDRVNEMKHGAKSYSFKRSTDKYTETVREYNTVSKDYKSDTCYKAGFFTTSEDDFIKLKQWAKDNGFMLTDTRTVGDGLKYVYTKDNIELEFIQKKIVQEELNSVDMTYVVSYWDMVLFKKLFASE